MCRLSNDGCWQQLKNVDWVPSNLEDWIVGLTPCNVPLNLMV